MSAKAPPTRKEREMGRAPRLVCGESMGQPPSRLCSSFASGEIAVCGRLRIVFPQWTAQGSGVRQYASSTSDAELSLLRGSHDLARAERSIGRQE
jgi:hypothetical protein